MDYNEGRYEDVRESTRKTLPPEKLDTEFKRKYPPDVLGREMDDGARVWKVFRDEATAHDHSMLDGWNKTLDILLIFAGLFSAVETAFIVESYKLLQPDKSADYTSTALYALVLATNHSAALSMLPSPPASSAQPSSSSLWINGLWFTSLFLALSVALLCILAKQWLAEYITRMRASATDRHWACRRMFYFEGLTTWHMSSFMSILPLLLHVALFLFFGGLAAFLATLNRGIGAWIGAASLALLLFYTVSIALPFWWPESPTTTPLVNQMRRALILAALLCLRCCVAAGPHVLRLVSTVSAFISHPIRESDTEADIFQSPSHHPPLISTLERAICSLEAHNEKSALRAHLDWRRDEMDCAALRWLILSVSNSDAVAAGLQAIGALRPLSQLAARMRSDDILKAATFDRAVIRTTSWSATEIVRIVRSLLCLRGETLRRGDMWLDVPRFMRDILKATSYPDMGLLWASIDGVELDYIERHAPAWSAAASPTLLSTTLLLVHCPAIDRLHVLHLLTCLQLDELSQEDWTCVFYALRWAPPTDLCPRHPVGGCSNLCLAELFAQMISGSSISQFGSNERIVTIKLIESALGACADNDTRLSKLPYLLELMASDYCPTISFSGSALEQLRRTLSEPYDWVPRDFVTLSSLNRAISNLLHIRLMHRDANDALRYDVDRLYLHLLASPGGFSSTHLTLQYSDYTSNSPSLATVLELVLSMPSTSLVDASNWRMLASLRLRDQQHAFLALADALSVALCVVSRQGLFSDPAPLVDSFFDLPLVTFLDTFRYSQRQAKWFGMDGVEVLRFLCLAQHCIELRPSWWFALLNAVTNDSDGDLIEFATTVDTMLALRGPCLECPGSPPGWDPSDQPSICTFDPSS